MARLAFFNGDLREIPPCYGKPAAVKRKQPGFLRERVQIFRCRPVLCRFEKMACTPVLFAMLKNVTWPLVSTGTIRGREGTRWGREQEEAPDVHTYRSRRIEFLFVPLSKFLPLSLMRAPLQSRCPMQLQAEPKRPDRLNKSQQLPICTFMPTERSIPLLRIRDGSNRCRLSRQQRR